MNQKESLMNCRIHVLLLAAAIVSVPAQAAVLSLNAGSGSGWQAITPSTSTPNNSYPSPSPIAGVGLAWEAANVGWNSSASYNTSGWSAYTGGWPNSTGATPFYARLLLNILGTPTSGSFTLQADDDSQAWVNGVLVPGLNDQNQGTYNPYTNTADISSYLHSGNNVIAFKAHNSAGGGYSVFALGGSVNFTPAPVNVLEPGSLALAGLALAVVLGRGRRRLLQA